MRCGMILKRKNAVLAAAGIVLLATAFALAFNHISASIPSDRVNAASAVSQINVTLGSLKSGANSQYTIQYTTSPTGAMLAEEGQITIQFPEGTSFSSSMPADSITVTTDANISTPTKSLTVQPVITSRTVSLTTPIPIGNNDNIKVVFTLTAGLRNPKVWQSYGSAASNRPLFVTTSADLAAAGPSASYEIVPDLPGTLTLPSATVVAGQTIVITGSNFTPAAAEGGLGPEGVHQITGTGTAIATLAGKKLESTSLAYPVNLDTTGWFSVALRLPDNSTTLTAGTLKLVFTDTAGQTGTISLTIPQWSVSISPGTSNRGTSAVVTGSGFPIGHLVRMTYGGTHFATVEPDTSGKISMTVRVPLDAEIPSTNNVQATVQGLAGFAVTSHDVPDASISISKASGPPGSLVTVTGNNFPRGSVQTLSIGGLSVLPYPAPRTDANGYFVAEILIPGVDEGELNVAASVNDISASAIFAVTSPVPTTQPPPNPITELSVGLEPLTSRENLVRMWHFDPATQRVEPNFGWSLFDPRPIFAPANTVVQLVSDQFYWISVQLNQTVTLNGRERVLFAGWNPITW